MIISLLAVTQSLHIVWSGLTNIVMLIAKTHTRSKKKSNLVLSYILNLEMWREKNTITEIETTMNGKCRLSSRISETHNPWLGTECRKKNR